MSLLDLAHEVSKKHEIFSNPLRALILFFVLRHKEVSWSDLKNFLETNIGKVNPNTLSFHLGRLLDTDLLVKIELDVQTRYKIVESNMPEIERMLGKKFLDKIKEKN